MAARRLIIIMVILLGISTLLAAALPDRQGEGEDEQTASQTATTATGTTKTEGQAVVSRRLKPETINADNKRQIVVIPLEAGQQLPLTVVSSTDDLVEIQRIGFVDVVGPDKPATFDILAGPPGDYGIRLLEAGRVIGRLEVTQPAPEESKPASAGDRP